MVAPLLLAGLSLLPKIPDMWAAVAGLFGKSIPKGVKEAGDLAGEVMDSLTKGQMSPEAQIKLKEIILQHEKEMAQLAFEEKKLVFEENRIIHEDLNDVRDLEKEAYKSDDSYISRTRPLILRGLFIICAFYIFTAPAVILTANIAGVDAVTLESVTSMMEWCASWLFGTFGTAYLGYAAVRTIDKGHPQFKEESGILNTIVKMGVGGKTKR